MTGRKENLARSAILRRSHEIEFSYGFYPMIARTNAAELSKLFPYRPWDRVRFRDKPNLPDEKT
jgi:hypothetical protein